VRFQASSSVPHNEVEEVDEIEAGMLRWRDLIIGRRYGGGGEVGYVDHLQSPPTPRGSIISHVCLQQKRCPKLDIKTVRVAHRLERCLARQWHVDDEAVGRLG